MSDNTPADWLKEAERLIEKFGRAKWCSGSDFSEKRLRDALDSGKEADETRAELLAHLAAQAAPLTTFDEWLARDEKMRGCRGLSQLERDQMRDAWNAALAAPGVPPQPTDGVATPEQPWRLTADAIIKQDGEEPTFQRLLTAGTIVHVPPVAGVPVGYVVCRHCGHTVKNRECSDAESKNCTAMHRPHDAGVPVGDEVLALRQTVETLSQVISERNAEINRLSGRVRYATDVGVDLPDGGKTE